MALSLPILPKTYPYYEIDSLEYRGLFGKKTSAQTKLSNFIAQLENDLSKNNPVDFQNRHIMRICQAVYAVRPLSFVYQVPGPIDQATLDAFKSQLCNKKKIVIKTDLRSHQLWILGLKSLTIFLEIIPIPSPLQLKKTPVCPYKAIGIRVARDPFLIVDRGKWAGINATAPLSTSGTMSSDIENESIVINYNHKDESKKICLSLNLHNQIFYSEKKISQVMKIFQFYLVGSTKNRSLKLTALDVTMITLYFLKQQRGMNNLRDPDIRNFTIKGAWRELGDMIYYHFIQYNCFAADFISFISAQRKIYLCSHQAIQGILLRDINAGTLPHLGIGLLEVNHEVERRLQTHIQFIENHFKPQDSFEEDLVFAYSAFQNKEFALLQKNGAAFSSKATQQDLTLFATHEVAERHFSFVASIDYILFFISEDLNEKWFHFENEFNQKFASSKDPLSQTNAEMLLEDLLKTSTNGLYNKKLVECTVEDVFEESIFPDSFGGLAEAVRTRFWNLKNQAQKRFFDFMKGKETLANTGALKDFPFSTLINKGNEQAASFAYKLYWYQWKDKDIDAEENLSEPIIPSPYEKAIDWEIIEFLEKEKFKELNLTKAVEEISRTLSFKYPAFFSLDLIIYSRLQQILHRLKIINNKFS